MEAMMATKYDTDVLICGAGAAGLTLAVDLARRGVAFRLIDKASAPFEGSRGKGVQPRSLEVFEDLGVLDRFLAKAGPYPPQRSYAGGGFVDTPMMEARDPTPGEPYATPLMSPQFLTEAALRDRLAELGSRPDFGVELNGFQQSDEGVAARIAGPEGEETVRARYLVGADGGRSFVRHHLSVDFPGQTLGVRAIVADVELEGLDRDHWHRWGEGSLGQIGLCPLQGTDLFQLQGPIPLEGEVDLSAEGLSAMLAERTGRSDLVVQRVLWASAYSMNARLADRYRVGRVFLVGDAAHIHPPTGGQGLNTSLQDAYNLGWKLAAVLEGAPEGLLDTYEAERRPIAAEVLGLSTHLLKAAKDSGDMRRGRDTQQLDLGYPDSSLALQRAPLGEAIRAGDRAPDAPCRDSAARSVRLFDLFRGPHWTLLGYEPHPGAAVRPRAGLRIHRIGDGGNLRDNAGHFGDAYGLAAGDWVLVRPDGYVGAVVSTGRLGELEAYLDEVGLPA
jgi:2-polyprenyl-6-methoxyphenol hydroxylase-like FAD-dependent oxidoreductase